MRRGVRGLCLCALVCAAWPLCAEQTKPPVAPPVNPRPRVTQDQLDAADAQFTGAANYDEVAHELCEQLLNFKITPQKSEVRSSKMSIREAREARAQEAKDAKATAAKEAKVGEFGIVDLEAYTANAQDAARKLASVGKGAVPELAMLFKASYAKSDKAPDAAQAAQVVYYTAWALAHIHLADAAMVLSPLMTNTAARPELRLIAVDATGWEKSADGVGLLQKVALNDPDAEMRKHALSQLSIIPEYWVQSEPIFVKALDDPNEEIRTQAVKACHFAHIFMSANPKLIELFEKDSSYPVRQYAMLTLARLKVRNAIPALARLLSKDSLDEKIRKQALATMVSITDVPFRDAEGALSWWEKVGKAEIAQLEELEKRKTAAEAGDAATLPIKPAPKFKPAPDGNENADVVPLSADAKAKVAELLPADDGPAPTPLSTNKMPAELTKDTPAAQRKDDSSEKIAAKKDNSDIRSAVAAKPSESAKARLIAPLPGTRFDDPPNENLAPNESTGSQRRKRRLAEQQ